MTRMHIYLLCGLLFFPWLMQGKSSITDSYNAEASKNYTRALEIMQEHAQADPGDEFFRLRIGWLQYLLGRYAEALNSYQAAYRMYPHLDAQLGILNCYLALGRWNEGISQSNLILKSYPQHTLIMAKAAYAAYMKQEYKLAADYYARIIKITPWDMEIRGYLVNNLYLSKDVKGAKIHYQKLKKYAPDSIIAKEYGKIFD